ncbi:hypothetical protein B0H11DRAFT_2348698 [Mycena galericulata]|nr:hypothetical protein B0H11DRAFT_2348698 [Mycena galericulata]
MSSPIQVGFESATASRGNIRATHQPRRPAPLPTKPSVPGLTTSSRRSSASASALAFALAPAPAPAPAPRAPHPAPGCRRAICGARERGMARVAGGLHADACAVRMMHRRIRDIDSARPLGCCSAASRHGGGAAALPPARVRNAVRRASAEVSS